jgi:hypothetical protein
MLPHIQIYIYNEDVSPPQVLCVSKRQPIYARFHFTDGEYRALVFDAAATTTEASPCL